jgi:hypothetical protein
MPEKRTKKRTGLNRVISWDPEARRPGRFQTMVREWKPGSETWETWVGRDVLFRRNR